MLGIMTIITPTLVCREALQQGVLRTNYVAAKERLQSGQLSYLNRSGATRNAISCLPCGSETLQKDMHGVRSPKLEQLTGLVTISRWYPKLG